MWKDLTMSEKAALIKLGVNNGITNLNDIRDSYNTYAKGGTLKEFDTNYQKWRNSLPVNLRKESNDYDLYDAYKAGLQPALEDDGYYHLGSRNPKTNRILKKPTHPTYLKAIIGDIHEGYYPVTKGNETYTLPYSSRFIREEQPITVPFKYGNGGYIPSENIKKRIANWEGASKATNRPFSVEAKGFNNYLPKQATSKLTQKQLDALFSYSYNVGSGNFNKRVVPVLTKYLAGKATIKDVQNSMWASGDSKLRGLAKRRAIERQMFGNGINVAPIVNNKVTLPTNKVPLSTNVTPNLSYAPLNLSYVPPIQLETPLIVSTPNNVNNSSNINDNASINNDNEDLPTILDSYNDIMSLHSTHNKALLDRGIIRY